MKSKAENTLKAAIYLKSIPSYSDAAINRYYFSVFQLIFAYAEYIKSPLEQFQIIRQANGENKTMGVHYGAAKFIKDVFNDRELRSDYDTLMQMRHESDYTRNQPKAEKAVMAEALARKIRSVINNRWV